MNLYLFIRKTSYDTLHFLQTKYVTDAFRISLVIIAPVWFFFIIGMKETAIDFGVGTILVSLIDYPGVPAKKRKAFHLTILLFLVVAFTSASLFTHPLILAFAVFGFCFWGAMLTVYGARPAIIGSACIVLMIFTIGLRPVDPVLYGMLVMSGALWGYLVSALIAYIRPFGAIHHVVGECIREMAAFISARGPLYDIDVPLNEAYRQIIANHARVSQRQEAVRSFILSEKKIVPNRHRQGEYYLAVAIALIDLYEQLSTMPFDYQLMRQHLSPAGRKLVKAYIRLIARDLDLMGRSLQTRRTYKDTLNISAKIADINHAFQLLIDRSPIPERFLLLEISKNTTGILYDLAQLRNLVTAGTLTDAYPLQLLNYDQFTDSPNYSWRQVLPELTLASPIFRFALRLSAAMAVAYSLTIFLSLGIYSYWIMLTIVIVVRPAFSLTSKRNQQRLAGTIIGVVAGLVLTMPGIDQPVQLGSMCLCLVGFFCFLQINYTVSASFITCVIIIGLSAMGGISQNIVLQRCVDTLIGCALSYAASFILPAWEVKYLEGYTDDLLKASACQIENLARWMNKEAVDANSYKLARKAVYTASANLSMALKRIKSEPVQLRVPETHISRFLLLHNFLFASISSFEIHKQCAQEIHFSKEEIETIRLAAGYLRNGPDRKYFQSESNGGRAAPSTFSSSLLYHTEVNTAQKIRLDYITHLCRQLFFCLPLTRSEINYD